MNGQIKDAVRYIEQTPYALLITVDEKNSPSLRYIGPFINNGPDIIFVTSRNSQKVKHIAANPVITLYFQDINQTVETFKSVAVTGTASQVPEGKEFDDAFESFIKKSPKTGVWIRKNTLYKLKAEGIQLTDFSRSPWGSINLTC